jgi:hypothetical protein
MEKPKLGDKKPYTKVIPLKGNRILLEKLKSKINKLSNGNDFIKLLNMSLYLLHLFLF